LCHSRAHLNHSASTSRSPERSRRGRIPALSLCRDDRPLRPPIPRPLFSRERRPAATRPVGEGSAIQDESVLRRRPLFLVSFLPFCHSERSRFAQARVRRVTPDLYSCRCVVSPRPVRERMKVRVRLQRAIFSRAIGFCLCSGTRLGSYAKLSLTRDLCITSRLAMLSLRRLHCHLAKSALPKAWFITICR
jgi:hypothetical protein